MLSEVSMGEIYKELIVRFGRQAWGLIKRHALYLAVASNVLWLVFWLVTKVPASAVCKY